MIFVVGPGISLLTHYVRLFAPLIPLPGHGTPATLATLWIEGPLAKFFPRYSLDRTGLKNLIAGFSTQAVSPPTSTVKFRDRFTKAMNSGTLLPLLSVPSSVSQS